MKTQWNCPQNSKELLRNLTMIHINSRTLTELELRCGHRTSWSRSWVTCTDRIYHWSCLGSLLWNHWRTGELKLVERVVHPKWIRIVLRIKSGMNSLGNLQVSPEQLLWTTEQHQLDVEQLIEPDCSSVWGLFLRQEVAMWMGSQLGSLSRTTGSQSLHSCLPPAPPSVDSCFLLADRPAIWGTGSGLLEVKQVDEVLEAKAHLEETKNQLLLTEHHHLHTEAPPPLTCWAVLFPSWAEMCRNVFRLAPLCWQAVRMARSASLKQKVLRGQSDCRDPFTLIKYWLLITVWYTATRCYFTPLTFSNKSINSPDTVCLECFDSDRVQTTTFSTLDVTEMFLAQTARPDSSPSSLSHPASLSSLFQFPWGGFWDM